MLTPHAAALVAKTKRGSTPLDIARLSKATPECRAYLSGENWKLFAAEGAVEAEAVEKMWDAASPEQMYDYIKAALEHVSTNTDLRMKFLTIPQALCRDARAPGPAV